MYLLATEVVHSRRGLHVDTSVASILHCRINANVHVCTGKDLCIRNSTSALIPPLHWYSDAYTVNIFSCDQIYTLKWMF